MYNAFNEFGNTLLSLMDEDTIRKIMVDELHKSFIVEGERPEVKPTKHQSIKSNKQRKHKQDKQDKQLEIEKYLSAHPEVLNKYFSEYVKKNLKIDWVVKEAKSDYFNSTKRYALGLFDNGKLISESTLVLNLNNF